MEQRVRTIVYWPFMSTDIRDTRDRCADCNRNVPTQVATPPLPTIQPSTPFEAVIADFFTYGGRHYPVVGDRLSGWVEVCGPQQAQPSQALLASFAIFFPSLPRLVAQKLLQFVKRPSSVSREYDIACPRPTSLSRMAEQRWQLKQSSAFLCPKLAQPTALTMTTSCVLCFNYVTPPTRTVTSHLRRSFLVVP